MKLIKVARMFVLISLLGGSGLIYAQDQNEAKPPQEEPRPEATKPAHDEATSPKQDEVKPPKQDEVKPPRDENKPVNQEDAKPSKKADQAQRADNQRGRIPDDKFQANFGREHTFRVSQGDYRNHRFQYGGYSFGFVGVWPSNWLYTQDVFVVDIGGVYYLCNPVYPGVNIALSFTL